MTTFLQLHLLVDYPPSNPNRDDLGRPKTAVVGGRQRMRISSQALKRAWRTSDLFEEAMADHIGHRTKRIGSCLYEYMVDELGYDAKKASKLAQEVASVFGSVKKVKKETPHIIETEQLVHISPGEWQEAHDYVAQLIESGETFDKKKAKLFKRDNTAVDIAMFGRMLASSASFNVEAAVQVAHAISIHETKIEADYFTAVDDLNRADRDDAGSAHLGETEFGSAIFYVYLCINWDLLVNNLNGDQALAQKAVLALVETCAKVTPNGKKASFAHQSRAKYIYAERGSDQPYSLFTAFMKPPSYKEPWLDAITAFQKQRNRMHEGYGITNTSAEFDVMGDPIKPLKNILDFVAQTTTEPA